jgi:carboxypeptidase PM20D1
MAHLDVVPVEAGTESNWKYPPFEGRIAEGYIWGRGAWDDKMSVMGILEAVEKLLADGFQPKRTIYIAFGHDEEVGGLRGAGRIAPLLQERGAALEFVLDEGSLITEGVIAGMVAPVALIGISVEDYKNAVRFYIQRIRNAAL